MCSSYILALDIGSSSVRAAIYDLKGVPVPEMSIKIERSLVSTRDGGAEIDADLAVCQVAEAIDLLMAVGKDMDGNIDYVAASCFWHSLVGIDANGHPTTKVFGWADTRSRKYVDRLNKKFDGSDVHNRTGARFHSSYWPAKLLWLRHENRAVFDRTAKWLSFCDYLALCLFGIPATSVSMASGTGIFNTRPCKWDAEMIRFLGVRADQLPLIVASDSTTFQIAGKYKRRWPRLKSAKWFPAIGDGAADNIGSGCTTKDSCVLMVGTSGAMRVEHAGEPPSKIPPGLWCYRLDRRRVVVGGALSDGGGLYRWSEDRLKLPDDAEEQISARDPAGHGLTFLPFLAGERSTGYHGDATGAVLGLRTSTDTVDILQAAMESVAYRFAEIFDQLNDVFRIRRIIASGGALRDSPVWTQMIADVLGRDLTLSSALESSSHGAVLLALESIGKIRNIVSRKTPVSKTVRHRPKITAVYRLAGKQHHAAYESILNNNP